MRNRDWVSSNAEQSRRSIKACVRLAARGWGLGNLFWDGHKLDIEPGNQGNMEQSCIESSAIEKTMKIMMMGQEQELWQSGDIRGVQVTEEGGVTRRKAWTSLPHTPYPCALLPYLFPLLPLVDLLIAATRGAR